MDQSAVVALYGQVGSLAAAIHGIAQDPFGYIVTDILDPLPTNAQYMARQFDHRLREFRDAGGAAALARCIERRASGAVEAFANCQVVSLCHNDLGQSLSRRGRRPWHLPCAA